MPWERGEIAERGLAAWKGQGRRSRGQGVGARGWGGLGGEGPRGESTHHTMLICSHFYF